MANDAEQAVADAEAAVEAGDPDADEKLAAAEEAVDQEEQDNGDGEKPLREIVGPTPWPGPEGDADETEYEEEEVQTTGELGNPKSVHRWTEREEEIFSPEVEEVSEDEKMPLILAGTWVTLAESDNIPEEVWGHEAQVTEAPMKNSDGDEAIPWRHQYQDEDTVFTVRTRDQFSATLSAKRGDFAVISDRGGRAGLGHAG